MEKIVYMKNGSFFTVNKDELIAIHNKKVELKTDPSDPILTILKKDSDEILKMINISEFSHAV